MKDKLIKISLGDLAEVTTLCSVPKIEAQELAAGIIVRVLRENEVEVEEFQKAGDARMNKYD